MNINILKQEKQPLLSRIEISAKVEFNGSTPSRDDITKSIATKLKQKEELTTIKHIYTEFGSQEAKVEAFIYDDKKVMSVLEKSKKKKGVKPASEKPAEPSTEKPTENIEDSQKEEKKEQPTKKQEEKSEESPAKESTKEKQEQEKPDEKLK